MIHTDAFAWLFVKITPTISLLRNLSISGLEPNYNGENKQ